MTPTHQKDAEVIMNNGSYYSAANALSPELGNATALSPELRKPTTIYSVCKRVIDIAGSIVGLLLLTPVFMIISILIKFEDPKGTVFFYQTRVGKLGKTFRMFKFRSMVSNAEQQLDHLLGKNEIKGAMFKMKNDPRITRVGKFIRKTSIDELPQLVNVLRGEMSLVGPRPPLPREVLDYTNYDRQRLEVMPGCTGLWQVSGRNDVGFHEMVELDLHYINNCNVLMDLKIIVKTVFVLFGSKNAF